MSASTPVAVELLAGAIAAVLAVVHLIGGWFRFLDRIPRARWLSFSGGVAVAYVFVHLLPEVSQVAVHVEEAVGDAGFLEHHIYVVALGGFLTYYGVERAAKRAGPAGEGAGAVGRDRERLGGDSSERVFWFHVGAFAAYNVLVGYLLLHREEPGLHSLLLFGVAMALHFVVNDWGLRHHHGDAYHRWGRWVLAAAVVAGTALGYLVAIDDATLAVLLAFLGGGVVLNVIKEELPEERESRFWTFVLGAGAYTVVLLG